MAIANATTPPAHAQTDARRDEPRRRTRTATILLVEDEPVTAEVFARALREHGLEVRLARDGMQALHALRDFRPDVVVLDLGLPTLPGIEVLRRLRGGDHAAVPVVIVSGAPAVALPGADELVEPGCWLRKPLRPRELVAAVQQLHGA